MLSELDQSCASRHFRDILLLLQVEDYSLTEAVQRTTVRKRPIA